MENKPQEKANSFTTKNSRLIHTFRGLMVDSSTKDPKYVVSDCGMHVKLSNANPIAIEMKVSEGRIMTKVPKGSSLCSKCQQAAGRRLMAQQTQMTPIRAMTTPKKIEEKNENL